MARCNVAAFRRYILSLKVADLRKALFIVAERLIECEELGFREFDPDPQWGSEAMLYWPGSGDNILEED